MGVIPLKILVEMSAVGYTSHHRIWGTERCLEHLMRYRGLQNVMNNYGTRKKTILHIEIRGTCEICLFNIKTPLFSSDRKEKPEF